MKKQIAFFILTLLSCYTAISQGTVIQITDAETNESLPNASIVINGTENLIANDDGYFTLPGKDDSIEVVITFLGYNRLATTAGALKKVQQVKLKRGVYELGNITISNLGNDPEAIMAAVKKNLNDNYKNAGEPVKNKVFFRESSTLAPIQVQVDVTKSTGFSKAQLKDINSHIKQSVSKIKNSRPQEFTDMLCNYYTGSSEVNGKTVYFPKIEVVKATKLRNKNGGESLEQIGKESLSLLAQHLDSTKHYRIKSGWFGTRDTVDIFDNNNNNNKKTVKNTNQQKALTQVQSFMLSNSLFTYNFITTPELYYYEYKGTVPSEGGQAYVLTFKPRKGKAKYAGTLYIDNTDFGVVRADFALAEGKKLSGMNLKFLLGIKFAENLSKGTLIYKKKADNSNYYLQYASKISGEYVYVNRPVKFIEITSGDKDVFAFDMLFEGSNTDRQEYFNIERLDITATDFESLKQPDFEYTYLTSYNPAIWKEYGGIEPLEEMKQFKAVE